ncbi:MAG: NAD(P)-binding domain-containing protein [Candidatus Solibacter usitatus]|nr:NAD(P)-binding domain-containing protein [Candidatus Solibacter usitatus]
MAIGFIGTGRMGAMLVRALLGADRPVDEDVWASNRSPEKLSELATIHHRLHAGSNEELARRCRTLFLCVRPLDTAGVLAQLAPLLTPDHLLVTISNVVELNQLAAAVPCRTAKVIPSIGQYIRRGVTLLIPGPRSTPADLAFLRDLLGRVSRIYEIDESHARAATDVVSCGPAFLARFCQAWAEAAHRMQPGIPIADFEFLVWETVRAASELPRAGIAGKELLEEVSTPGGMTYEGLQAMDAVLPAMWNEVMRRTTERERELKAAVSLSTDARAGATAPGTS